jgi:hypothetical protein
MFGRLGFTRDVSESRRILTTLAELIATLSSGLFAGAAVYINFVYINLVEHPARMQTGIRPAQQSSRRVIRGRLLHKSPRQ